MNKTLEEKNLHLGEVLANMNRVIVAFSGGVDSALVLKRAQEELGDDVLAVVVGSELFRVEELEDAVQLAEKMGVKVLKTEIKELNHPKIVENSPDSWYYSKQMLYNHLNELAEELGYNYVLDGMIMDDLADFRPGLRARTEAGARSVLQEVGMYKREVRELANALNVPVWDKPASCSLASRIPYGVALDKVKIAQVNDAELFLVKLGFPQTRVRHHGNVARIEVTPSQIAEMVEKREQIQMKLTALGFTYVSIDLLGYHTGNMNKELSTTILGNVVIK